MVGIECSAISKPQAENDGRDHLLRLPNWGLHACLTALVTVFSAQETLSLPEDFHWFIWSGQLPWLVK